MIDGARWTTTRFGSPPEICSISFINVYIFHCIISTFDCCWCLDLLDANFWKIFASLLEKPDKISGRQWRDFCTWDYMVWYGPVASPYTTCRHAYSTTRTDYKVIHHNTSTYSSEQKGEIVSYFHLPVHYQYLPLHSQRVTSIPSNWGTTHIFPVKKSTISTDNRGRIVLYFYVAGPILHYNGRKCSIRALLYCASFFSYISFMATVQPRRNYL